MRVLGLDVGGKRIGVALSDPEGIFAFALTVIERKSDEFAVQEIDRLAKENQVGTIVVGLPRSLDGAIRQQALAVQAFAHTLEERTGLPVAVWDERLSTVAAERMLAEVGAKTQKRKEKVDSIAASFILQGYLDWARGRERQES